MTNHTNHAEEAAMTETIGTIRTGTVDDGITWDEGRALWLNTVAVGDWAVSTTSGEGPHRKSYRLNVLEIMEDGSLRRHASLDGLLFGTSDQAKECAYEAGVIGFYNYFAG